MITIQCQACGAGNAVDENLSTFECEYCGKYQPMPRFQSPEKASQFNRAVNLRFKKEYDRASVVYENLIAQYKEEAEAYWGLCLCRYGIEFVDDVLNGRKVPTCHRTIATSILDDEDYQNALKFATSKDAAEQYIKDANEIDNVQKRIMAIARNEKPYDIFICYKETDEITGDRTEDSVWAQDICTNLMSKGYRVFFSRVTLANVAAGADYEAYIYSALKTAKIMLVFGTKLEYFNAVWVRNEWSRFLKMSESDSNKVLIPCYKGMDAYGLPEEFSKRNIQGISMESATFSIDLFDNINRILNQAQSITSYSSKHEENFTSNSLLERAFIFLKDGEFLKVIEYCNKVLDMDSKNGMSYLCMLLAKMKVRSLEELSGITYPISHMSEYKHAVSFLDKETSEKLVNCAKAIETKIDNKTKCFQIAEEYKTQITTEIKNANDKCKELIQRRAYLNGYMQGMSNVSSELIQKINAKKAELEDVRKIQTSLFVRIFGILSYLLCALMVFLGISACKMYFTGDENVIMGFVVDTLNLTYSQVFYLLLCLGIISVLLGGFFAKKSEGFFNYTLISLVANLVLYGIIWIVVGVINGGGVLKLIEHLIEYLFLLGFIWKKESFFQPEVKYITVAILVIFVGLEMLITKFIYVKSGKSRAKNIKKLTDEITSLEERLAKVSKDGPELLRINKELEELKMTYFLVSNEYCEKIRNLNQEYRDFCAKNRITPDKYYSWTALPLDR